jgi:hypothetical protein
MICCPPLPPAPPQPTPIQAPLRNNDSPGHPNSQSVLVGLASHALLLIKILSNSTTTFYAFFFNNCLNNLRIKFFLLLLQNMDPNVDSTTDEDFDNRPLKKIKKQKQLFLIIPCHHLPSLH